MARTGHNVLPEIGPDEEFVLFVFASARTTAGASARTVLDQARFENDGSAPFYLTEVVMEVTTGQVNDLAIEITDTWRNRTVLKNQTSFKSLGAVEPAASGTDTSGTCRFYLDAAYRVAERGSFNVIVEELAGTARTVRVTLIGYHRLPRKAER